MIRSRGSGRGACPGGQRGRAGQRSALGLPATRVPADRPAPLSSSPTSESGLQQIGPAVPHVGRGLRKLSGPDSGPIELQLILSDSIRAATSKPTTGILPSTRLIEWLVPIAGQRCGDGGGRRPVGQPGMGSLRTIRTRSAPARGRLPTALGDLTGTPQTPTPLNPWVIPPPKTHPLPRGPPAPHEVNFILIHFSTY